MILRLSMALVLCLGSTACVRAEGLKSGYVVCEAPGQLRWFVGLPSVDGLWRSEPHPRRLPVTFDDTIAQKALRNGWCKRTMDLASEPVRTVESCDNNPLGKYFPNGGCRRIAVGTHTWYTFADAVTK